jgi:hypothetical protein
MISPIHQPIPRDFAIALRLPAGSLHERLSQLFRSSSRFVAIAAS